MHNYPSFSIAEEEDRLAFVEARRFANLVVNGPEGPVVAHLPMIVLRGGQGAGGEGTGGEGAVIEGHVARSNPLWRAAEAGPAPALAVFNGPDAYVAAGFYPSKQVHGKVAPTWNYMAVHAAGPMEIFDAPDALTDHLVRLTDVLEAGEPAPWAVSDAPEGFTERLVGAIVGLRIRVQRLEGIAKLSQNMRPTDREGVIAGLTARGVAREQHVVAEMTARRA